MAGTPPIAPYPLPAAGELPANTADWSIDPGRAALGVPVAYTAQPGMRTTPADREIVGELQPAEGDWELVTWRYSAFVRTDLLERMRAAGRDQLILCGVYAHVGVLATAIDAFSKDIETFLVADAVADFSADHHRMALTYAAERCAQVVTAKEVFG